MRNQNDRVGKERNNIGDRIIKLGMANNLAITPTKFKQEDIREWSKTETNDYSLISKKKL